MIELRDYQKTAISQLYSWLRQRPGNPCLVLPTGSGKSIVIAAICADGAKRGRRVLMLTHQRELIAQNAAALERLLPGINVSIYSAGLGRKEIGAVTYGSIQSLRGKSQLIGHVDAIIIDEAHMVSHKTEGGYRTLISDLSEINPALRVIGLTATPWRLGHGTITDGDALFDAPLIEPVTISELVARGALSPLRSKLTERRISTDGVHRRGGEYIESELQAAVDVDEITAAVVDETIQRGEGRKSWLFFCTGVQHSLHVRDALRQRGIAAETVTGQTPTAERDRILSQFRAGQVQAVTNADVLTTGFDHPGIDLIVMLRPTMSPTLYIQMAGRGMRRAPNKTDCLVLDYAGVVSTHGAITSVQPPKKAGSGEPPVKPCPDCGELVPLSDMACPACGHEFPPPEPKIPTLHDDDIMGLEPSQMKVTEWRWRRHISRSTGKEMLCCTYYGALSDTPITEYLPVLHGGYAGRRASSLLIGIAERSGASLSAMAGDGDLHAVAAALQRSKPPQSIYYRTEGRYHRVSRRTW